MRGRGIVDARCDRADAVDCVDNIGTIAEAMRAPQPPIGSREPSAAPRAYAATPHAVVVPEPRLRFRNSHAVGAAVPNHQPVVWEHHSVRSRRAVPPGIFTLLSAKLWGTMAMS